jgi:predicted negative regulator of RcsB-dependent stress response
MMFSRMLGMLTVPDLTPLFLGVVVSLGIAFVWMLWEIEQTSKPRRNSDRFG